MLGYAQVWNPNLEDGEYKNPIIYADYSDPDVVKVGDDFMTSSSFNTVPALPILHSKDLVNWWLINHAIDRFDDPDFDVPQHGNGRGEPVLTYAKPDVGESYPTMVPQTSDEFEKGRLGLQWQWHANNQPGWYSLTDRMGNLRLFSQPMPDGAENMWPVSNLLLQKLPAPEFTATTKMSFHAKEPGETSGLIVMGADYAYLALRKTPDGYELVQARGLEAPEGMPEEDVATVPLEDGQEVYLRVVMEDDAQAQFAYSRDGEGFESIGEPFQAVQGRWIGAKVGLFAVRPEAADQAGYADFDFFRIQ